MTPEIRSVTQDQRAWAQGMAGPLDVPSPTVLKEAGQHEAAALAALIDATSPGQSVHGARRRIKQLRSLLRLLRHPLGESAYADANAALREAAEALAGHRRAEALVAAAEKLEQAPGAGSGFWRGLAEANRIAHAAEGDPVAALAVARQAIARAADVLAAAPLGEAGPETVGEAFADAYRRARKQLRKGLADGDPDTLHEARKHVIDHLHQLKLLRPGGEHRLAALETLREVLGDLNDLDELEQLAAGAEILRGDARLMRKARARLLRRAARDADKLFRHKPAAFVKRMGHAATPRSRRAGVALQGGE